MFGRLLFCLLLALSVLSAQSGLTLKQLQDILRSSKDQGLSDRDVAKYLKDQPLSFRLTEVMVEDFQGLGVGPRTLQALRLLQESSAGMSEALPVEIPAGPVQPPPPSEEEQKRIIAEARANALAYTDRLPDFVCLQITRRYVDPSGLEMDWLKYDEVKTRVSYVEGSENYEVVSACTTWAERRPRASSARCCASFLNRVRTPSSPGRGIRCCAARPSTFFTYRCPSGVRVGA